MQDTEHPAGVADASADPLSQAARLYGPKSALQAPIAVAATGDASPPAAAPSADPASIETPAPVYSVEGVKAAVPNEILELRRADPTRRLYGPGKDIEEAIPVEAFASGDLAPEVQQAIASEVREIAADMGLSAADVKSVRSALSQVRAEPPTDEARIANRERIVEAMNATYGKGAHQAWLDARLFVAMDPRRAGLLAPVGDDPATVLRIVDLAQAAKRAGRFKSR